MANVVMYSDDKPTKSRKLDKYIPVFNQAPCH